MSESQKTEGTFEVIAEEYSKKVKDKVYYEIRPTDCPIKRKYCRKYERTIVDHSELSDIQKSLVEHIAENKNIPYEEAEKAFRELWKDAQDNINDAGIIIPENWEQCKYMASNGLGNEDGVLYLECSCVQKSIKFICDDED